MIYSSWDIQQNILKLVILGHFLPFYSPKNPKTQNVDNEKKCWRYHHMKHVYQKSQSYDIRFRRYRARQTELFVILGHFLSFYHLTSPIMILKIKIFKTKKIKQMPGDIILPYIHGYHTWRSYNIWSLKYKVRQTEIFVILDHFLLFQLLDNLEHQNFTLKNAWRYYHFTHLQHKWQSYGAWFLRYGAHQTIFSHSGPFLALSGPYEPKKSKFWKN